MAEGPHRGSPQLTWICGDGVIAHKESIPRGKGANIRVSVNHGNDVMLIVARYRRVAIAFSSIVLLLATPMAMAGQCGSLPGLAVDLQAIGNDVLILGLYISGGAFVGRLRSDLTLEYRLYSAAGAPWSFADPRDGSVWFIAGWDSIGSVRNGDLETLRIEQIDTDGAMIDSLVVRANDILVTTRESRSYPSGIIRLDRASGTIIERKAFEENCNATSGSLGADDIAYFSLFGCSMVLRVDSLLNFDKIEVPATFAPIQIAANATGTVGFLQDDPWIFGAVRKDGRVDYYDSGAGGGLSIADMSAGTDGSLWASDLERAVYRFSNGILRKFDLNAEQVSAGGGMVWTADRDVVCGQPEPLLDGDCNNDFAVEIHELITCVRIALGDEALSECSACDRGRDGSVTIDELIHAVRAAQSSIEIPKVKE